MCFLHLVLFNYYNLFCKSGLNFFFQFRSFSTKCRSRLAKTLRKLIPWVIDTGTTTWSWLGWGWQILISKIIDFLITDLSAVPSIFFQLWDANEKRVMLRKDALLRGMELSVLLCVECVLLVCLFVDLRPTRGYFTHMETVKGFKIWPMLGTYQLPKLRPLSSDGSLMCRHVLWSYCLILRTGKASRLHPRTEPRRLSCWECRITHFLHFIIF